MIHARYLARARRFRGQPPGTVPRRSGPAGPSANVSRLAHTARPFSLSLPGVRSCQVARVRTCSRHLPGTRPQRRVTEVRPPSRPLPGAGSSPGLPGARLCQVGDVRAHSETTKSDSRPLPGAAARPLRGCLPRGTPEAVPWSRTPGSGGEAAFTSATWRSWSARRHPPRSVPQGRR